METYKWLNEDSRKFLANGYLQAGQTAEHRIQDIAAHAVKLSGDPLLGERFLHHMSKGHFSLSSPIWSNYGTTRGLPVSCFGGYVEDSVEGILYAHSEQGMLTKMGGGTSLYFGDVRCRGSEIKNNGTSHGVVPFIRMMDTMTDVISQGSTRRGYMATYLPIEHKDIDEFLDIGSDGNDIQGIMTGVTVSDAWLSSMEEGDRAKRKIWAKVLKRRSEQGYPYIMFSDTVNNGKPDVYKKLNMEVQASNLCVTGDTKILTKDGYKEINTLAGQYVECWNGKEWSNTAIAKTSEAANVLKVTVSNGSVIRATPDHKWYVYTGNASELQEKRTYELLVGDKVPAVYEDDFGSSEYVEILNVADEGEIAETYCGNEPKAHKLVFNGILTGNCSEIALPSNIDESFTCVLSSLNLLHYDSWKDSDAVEVLVAFLDTVVTEFINSAKGMPVLERAVSFAENHRALGMGVLGWHSYLMSKNIPFESMEASQLNPTVFKTIKEQAYEASRSLGAKYGTVLGTDRRNTTLMAIAPTKSSSFILGQVSQGIEPIMSNYFVNNTAKVVSVYKNPYLKELLQTLGMDTPEVWKSIEKEDGSVQHLNIPDEAKQVYKTFAEISSEAVIDQAATRQAYVDQSQSVNLMVSPLSSTKELNGLYMRAWKTGVKSLYYQFTLSAAQVKAREISAGGCTVCEG